VIAVYFVLTVIFLVRPYNKNGVAVAEKIQKPRKWGVLVLFASIPTLFCCALPILLVSLGMGSVVASIYGEHLPFLQWFGRHEATTFGITALILFAGGWVLYRSGRTCPVDPELAKQCDIAQKWNVRFFWGAVVIWCIGAFSAFVLPLIQ
jgi:mercuric ion transport protein